MADLRSTATPAEADSAAIPRVAYHLADADKVNFVLGNIENHIAGEGGPDKVHIVLVIHGLMDSQATWTPMINKLRGDPVIRRNYQFWFYSYPSGYPFPYSAAILREELDKVEKQFPKLKPMVVIGHSIGGASAGCFSPTAATSFG